MSFRRLTKPACRRFKSRPSPIVNEGHCTSEVIQINHKLDVSLARHTRWGTYLCLKRIVILTSPFGKTLDSPPLLKMMPSRLPEGCNRGHLRFPPNYLAVEREITEYEEDFLSGLVRRFLRFPFATSEGSISVNHRIFELSGPFTPHGWKQYVRPLTRDLITIECHPRFRIPGLLD